MLTPASRRGQQPTTRQQGNKHLIAMEPLVDRGPNAKADGHQEGIGLLPHKDSNLDKQSQSLLS